MHVRQPRVAIIDYALGNLFSVQHACARVGLHAFITAVRSEILDADTIILPGVGAFGDAMESLRRLDLVHPLRDIAQSGTPLLGICLGQQLLMRESFEFGRHRGLGIFEGEVVRFENPQADGQPLKVPQIGWNRIHRPVTKPPNCWNGTPLTNIADGEFFYFVHSYYVKPADQSVVLSTTRYGHLEFCSGLCQGNIAAVQFHPERSGRTGLAVYSNLANWIRSRTPREEPFHAA